MEEVKVSELNVATDVNDDDLIMIVQDGFNKKIEKENLFKNTEEEIENLEEQVTDLQDQIKTADFSIYIIPSTTRGSSGYGETSIDISGLNASKILTIVFHESSTHMVWGTTSDLSINPRSLNIYGFRIAGTYTGQIATTVRVVYI